MPAGTRRLSPTLVGGAIALAAVLPFLPTMRAAFVYDDTTIIRDNPLLRGWDALASVWSAPYWPATGADVSGLYRPLHVAILALLWNAGDGTAWPFHLYALLLHALVALEIVPGATHLFEEPGTLEQVMERAAVRKVMADEGITLD